MSPALRRFAPVNSDSPRSSQSPSNDGSSAASSGRPLGSPLGDPLGCSEGSGDSLVGGGVVLAPLEPAGGVSDVPDGASLGGIVEPSLLAPGGWIDGSGLGCGDSLVGGGVGLVPLDSSGRASDVPDGGSLGGVESVLLPSGDTFDPPDGSGLVGCESLEAGPGVLGVEPGGWLDVVDGRLLPVVDGSGDTTDPSEPTDTGDSLGGGEPVSELVSLTALGVVSEPSDDGILDVVGLVDAVEGIEPGDGVSAEDSPGAEPELG